MIQELPLSPVKHLNHKEVYFLWPAVTEGVSWSSLSFFAVSLFLFLCSFFPSQPILHMFSLSVLSTHHIHLSTHYSLWHSFISDGLMKMILPRQQSERQTDRQAGRRADTQQGSQKAAAACLHVSSTSSSCLLFPPLFAAHLGRVRDGMKRVRERERQREVQLQLKVWQWDRQLTVCFHYRNQIGGMLRRWPCLSLRTSFHSQSHWRIQELVWSWQQLLCDS